MGVDDDGLEDEVGDVGHVRGQPAHGGHQRLERGEVDLLEAVETCAGDPEIRAVCVTGAGRGFSSGADLKGGLDDLTPEGKPDLRKILVERYHPIITGLRRMDKPVVAAVNGPAVGIGLSFALAADLVVANRATSPLGGTADARLEADGRAPPPDQVTSMSSTYNAYTVQKTMETVQALSAEWRRSTPWIFISLECVLSLSFVAPLRLRTLSLHGAFA